MKAITILQPFAHAIAVGEKRVENRSWPTTHRGELAIHAGKSRRRVTAEDECRWPDMAFGAVVAVAELTDCIALADLEDAVAEKPSLAWLLTHRHVEGPIIWVLANVRRLAEPIPCLGQQGLFDLPAERLKSRGNPGHTGADT